MEKKDEQNKYSSDHLISELVKKEKELRELISSTYKMEGFSQINLLQRSLLEIIKEQNLNENTDNSTR